MAIALKLARQGIHGVGANPMVGCVIEKEGEIIAKGYHQTFGKEHAEINALNAINHQAHGCTIFVTLEPCSHQGKTPPCAQAIINSGAKKVIIATLDPNPLVSGQGVKMLRNAGIEVAIGLLESKALELNRGFIKRMKTNLPFVTCKIGMSLDGKTSMQSGESKWITSESARQDVQLLRAQNQAILTGSGTVLSDNPSMTVRLDNVDANPLRVVIDGKQQINNTEFNIFSDDAPTQVFNNSNTRVNESGKLDLTDVLTQLANQGINTLLLEAGPGLIGAMINEDLIDEFVFYVAPTLMGSSANSMMTLAIDKMSDKINLSINDIRIIDKDIRISAKIDT